MADLISRQALIANLNTFAPEHYNALINSLITKEPAVDAVEVVRVDNFDTDRRNECAAGIHFFITRQEAVDY